MQRADELEQSALQARTNERESKKVFLDKQADLYFETVRVVSMIATAKTPDEIRDSDERRFWELYWGELGMVEDWNVEDVMVLFGRSLHAFRVRRFATGNRTRTAQRSASRSRLRCRTASASRSARIGASNSTSTNPPMHGCVARRIRA